MSNRKHIAINDLNSDHAEALSESEVNKVTGGLIVKFENVLISSYQTGGSAGADSVPLDSFSFNYAKIR